MIIQKSIQARLVGLLTIIMVCLSTTALAHGVIMNQVIDNITGDVLINAKFDTGEIMNEAQISIFAPNDLANPWLVAPADEFGNFRFSPDKTIPGLWEIQIRQAGHGEVFRLELSEGVMASLGSASQSGGFTVAQIVLMSASIIWGFIGTAFYFSAKRLKQGETNETPNQATTESSLRKGVA